MSKPLLFALMLVAGMGIPVMAALNAAMGQHLGNPITAVAILCACALVCALILLAALPGATGLDRLSGAPTIAYAAGMLFIVYIASITYSAPRIGLGNAVLMVLIGQLICAAIIDHFGLFGAARFPLGPTRIAGFAVIAAGFWLVVWR